MNSYTAIIDALKALATPAIASAGIAIAVAQLRLADIRLTHDLFDRRYAIYAAARKFIQQICQKNTVTIEELSSFYYASADAIFVLDGRLAAFLDKLRADAHTVAALHDKIGRNQASPTEIEERSNLINWFSSQIETLTENFKPFLRTNTRGGNAVCLPQLPPASHSHFYRTCYWSIVGSGRTGHRNPQLRKFSTSDLNVLH